MSTVADRIKLHRCRRKAGRAIVMFEVDEVAAADVLVRAGFLDLAADDRRSLSDAMRRFFETVIQDERRRE